MNRFSLSALVLCLGVSGLITACGGGNGGSSNGNGNNGGGSSTPPPTVTSISPTSVPAGSAALTLTVNGTGFTSATAIQVGGVTDTTTYVSATKVTATVEPSQMVSGGDFAVIAANDSSTSAASPAINLEVTNPAPVISTVLPESVTVGAASPVVSVAGTGFVPTTVVNVNGSARTTIYVSATQVSVELTSADVAAAANLSLTAVNTKPGGGTSQAATLVVNPVATNPAPAITTTIPAAVTVGSGTPIIAIAGTGFVPTTVINVNGSARTTVFSSATQVNVQLTDADVKTAGSLSLTAVNPAPGGGTSKAVTLSVLNPVPRIASLSPTSVLVTKSTPSVITVTGTNFIPSSTVQLNGTNRATTYVSATQLTFQLTAADQSTAQNVAITVVNPTPGGGTSFQTTLAILQPLSTPVITQVSPNQFLVGSAATTITVTGTNLIEQVPAGFYAQPAGSITWNGTTLQTTAWGVYGAQQTVTATVPASLLTAVDTASIAFVSTVATPATSNTLQVSITNPPAPTLTSINPTSGPVNTATSVTLNGTGFTANSTVAVNGATVPSTYVNSSQLTVTIPADSIATPGNANITVTTPAPGGGTTSPLLYTVYVSIPNNDIVYNTTDGLIYASVPGTAPGSMGNSIVGIDPVTGNVLRTIWVGSNPNKLALSADGKQLFVGLDGASEVTQIDLTAGKPVNKFPLGGGAGLYNALYTATSLAAVPGQPNSVAVLASNGAITIYDSGVARANTSSTLNTSFGSSIAFGSSASTLYASGQGIEQLTVDATGITAATTIYQTGTNGIMQYDNGRIYLPSGAVIDASTGALQGTFYATASTTAQGPVVSDSTLGRAFIANQSYTSNGNAILAFNESTFDPAGSISYNAAASNGYYNGPGRIIRWGQNGVALAAQQVLYIFQSPAVKDISSSPADLALTLTAPSTAATGSSISYVATVKNNGASSASGATVALNLDSSLILGSVTPSQGFCGTGTSFLCNLGTIAKGASATVTISAKPTAAGTLNTSATVDSVSYDPTADNNQAAASTTVTGDQYSAVPSISAISPNLVQAGSDAFTLTVNGSGFNSGSTINLGGTALTTTYVSATQLTASVDATSVANYGWSPVTVTNPSPGGGTSPVSPLTIYALVNVEANSMLFDPFSQKLYASMPSASTPVTGNSIVSINPATAAVGTPVLVGSEPNAIAETSDGNYIYAALTGSNSIAQFSLLQQKLTATIPVATTGGGGTTGSVTPTWIATMPGSDTTLAVDIANGWSNFGIFDISGNTGTFRPNFSGYYDGINPTFADATHLYAADGEFYRYTVDANGLTEQDGWTLNGLGGYNGGFKLANGIVYGGNGGIIDPRTTPPTQLATLQLPGNSPSFGSYGSGVVPDISTQKDFLMLDDVENTYAYAIARYNTNTYLPEDVLTLPTTFSAPQGNWTMLRWGQDGLALLGNVQQSSDTGGTQTNPQIILLRGPFVTPQLLGTGSKATLTASSVTTIAHGSGNTLLTLTGSSFAPGVAVTWNGSYRTTTIVDATHLTVAIPASDLAAAGSASLVATNPGATASSALTITIN